MGNRMEELEYSQELLDMLQFFIYYLHYHWKSLHLILVIIR